MTSRLLVAATASLTSTERATEISRELFNISRPTSVRGEEDVTSHLFGWVTHPTDGSCVMNADLDYVITVHQDNDLNNLIGLFSDLPTEESEALEAYIDSEDSFPFMNILPSTLTILTEEEFGVAGYIVDEAF